MIPRTKDQYLLKFYRRSLAVMGCYDLHLTIDSMRRARAAHHADRAAEKAWKFAEANFAEPDDLTAATAEM